VALRASLRGTPLPSPRVGLSVIVNGSAGTHQRRKRQSGNSSHASLGDGHRDANIRLCLVYRDLAPIFMIRAVVKKTWKTS